MGGDVSDTDGKSNDGNYDPVSALSGHDDVELVGAVDRGRESTAERLISAADVRENAVEDDRRLRVALDRADVVRQTDEECHASVFSARQSCVTQTAASMRPARAYPTGIKGVILYKNAEIGLNDF